MLFSGITFIYFFLPAVILVYFMLPAAVRNYWLLSASLFFYFWGEPGYTLVLLASCAMNYALGLLVRRRRLVLAAGIAINLAALGIFKYTKLPLPLGVSFYTFQAISYAVDVYRGDVAAQRNPFAFGTYITFFPQLVAGPIVRYGDIARELESRRHTIEGFASGAARFVVGLSKKVLIANQLGELASAGDAPESVALSIAAVVAYAMQIYFDFSGYSDMAIGLGRIFGFTLPENFNYPFISQSASEFWRRWHITLGRWFRDYLYIPLGGARVSRLKWVRNLMIVWLCTGIWHGASLNFALWGLYFGVLIGAEKLFFAKALESMPVAVRRIYALIAVTVSFVIFKTEAAADIPSRFADMLGISGLPLLTEHSAYLLKSFAVTVLLAAIGATPLPRDAYLLLARRAPRLTAILEPVGVLLLLALCTAYLVDSTFNPFLYFRF